MRNNVANDRVAAVAEFHAINSRCSSRHVEAGDAYVLLLVGREWMTGVPCPDDEGRRAAVTHDMHPAPDVDVDIDGADGFPSVEPIGPSGQVDRAATGRVARVDRPLYSCGIVSHTVCLGTVLHGVESSWDACGGRGWRGQTPKAISCLPAKHAKLPSQGAHHPQRGRRLPGER